MSIIRCPRCERSIDMDKEDTEDVQVGEDTEIHCVPCAMEIEEETLARGRELAGEHGRDLAKARDDLDSRQSTKDAGRGHLLDPDDGVMCPRCKQKMADRDQAEGCEDFHCPFIGGER